MALGRALRELDPRLRIGLGLALGLVVWQSGPAGLLVLALVLGWLLGLSVWRAEAWDMGRGLWGFVAAWTILKLAADALAGAPDLGAALLLGVRLAVLVGLGILLAVSSSPRNLGLGLAWLLRPVAGRQAWQAALALALMLHFLPRVWQTFATASRTLARRAPHLGPWRRLTILPAAGLRALSRSTWAQAVAIAARGLDDPAAWELRRPWRAAEVAAVAALLAAAIILTRV